MCVCVCVYEKNFFSPVILFLVSNVEIENTKQVMDYYLNDVIFQNNLFEPEGNMYIQSKSHNYI